MAEQRIDVAVRTAHVLELITVAIGVIGVAIDRRLLFVFEKATVLRLGETEAGQIVAESRQYLLLLRGQQLFVVD